MPQTTAATRGSHTLHVGDALTVLCDLPDASMDAVVTDPPYAIKRIPSARFGQAVTPQPNCTVETCVPRDPCRSCVRAHSAALFAQAPMLGQQSQNWHAKETHSRGYADNDPRQFQTWCGLWLTECLRVLKPGGHLVAFGGTRTWHRLATAAEDAGFELRDSLAWIYSSGMPKSLDVHRTIARSDHDIDPTIWENWGTALKPAFEPIVLARRPLDGTMADNVARWAAGPLNLNTSGASHTVDGEALASSKWPCNVHLDFLQAEHARRQRGQNPERFFWVSKPGRTERVVVDGVAHPTVKPLDLMRRLIRLVTPPGGVVLDPFAGSGTTIEASLLEGFDVIGIEREPSYTPLIDHRVARVTGALSGPAGETTPVPADSLF